jgi:hypothetical protein
VATAGLGGLALWAQLLSAESLFIATKAVLLVLAATWATGLAFLLAKRLGWTDSAPVRSCLAILRAEHGIPESGPLLCRKHGVFWGNGAVGPCAHRTGGGCVFPRQVSVSISSRTT